MRRHALWFAIAALTLATPALAAETKTYQVTGPVVETTADSITVLKGKDNWQIAKDAGTKITGDPKKGDKVTIYYRMIATDIETKPAKKK
ncbi:MAG TPA: hypothetical protein VKM54_03675 [Myxococcota bacterium]|nr:hypothetical protein [Myxococcota bacterium]